MFEYLQQGGPVMWAIFALSVVALFIFLEKFFNLHRAHINSSTFLQGIYNLVENDSVVEAVTICEDTPGPEARIVREAVLHMEEDRETIWKYIEEAALQEIPRLERRLNMLGALMRIIPVLGFLGTVMGMMAAATVMEAEAPLVHAGDVSGGIREAFLTTVFALSVAIPLYAAHEFLLGRVAMLIEDMERTAVEVFNFVMRRKRRLERIGNGEPAA